MKKDYILIILTILSLNSVYSQNTPSLTNLIESGKSISKDSDKNPTQKEWFSNIEIEFGVNNRVDYTYNLYDDNNDLISTISSELDNKTSFGILYNLNYPIFNKLTLGAISGFQYQSQLKISTLKIGGILRYHFIDYESVNINLMTAYNIALSKNIKSEMGNMRIGLQFPIKRTDDFILTMNIFGDYNFYGYKEKVYVDINEKPDNLAFRSYGFSIGLQF